MRKFFQTTAALVATLQNEWNDGISSLQVVRLNATAIISASLEALIETGFTDIEEVYYQDSNDDAQIYRFWKALNPNTGEKVAFFAPLRDESNIDINVLDMHDKAYLMTIKELIITLQEKGYLCILPVSQYAPMETVIGKMARRMHWVTLFMHNKETIFFDPKSTQWYFGKFSNQLYKDFVAAVGGTYIESKTEHPQGALDMNRCGYFCLVAIRTALSQWQSGQEFTFPKTMAAEDVVQAGHRLLGRQTPSIRRLSSRDRMDVMSTALKELQQFPQEMSITQQKDGLQIIHISPTSSFENRIEALLRTDDVSSCASTTETATVFVDEDADEDTSEPSARP